MKIVFDFIVKKTALDELREEEERIKEQRNRKDYWLRTGIIVKVSNFRQLCYCCICNFFALLF